MVFRGNLVEIFLRPFDGAVLTCSFNKPIGALSRVQALILV